MSDWLQRLFDWLQALTWQEQFCLGVVLFLATFVLSLGATIWIVIQIPATYFCKDHPSALAQGHPIIRWSLRLLKNFAGLALVILGIVMSLPGVPGQGILTILIGLMLLDFPGKRRLEQWMIRRERVSTAVNRLRARFNRPPLVLNEELCPKAENEERNLSPQ
ncbi:MAG: hypothetical protein JNM56_23840 [Planctomycetia bacterium]|nr:hypothetical protein [Planctomycetia bacterium]